MARPSASPFPTESAPALSGEAFVPKCSPGLGLGLPDWVEVQPSQIIEDVMLAQLGAGERAAIALALTINADLILIDERKGTTAALGKGLAAAGTLGLLALAARRGLIKSRRVFRSP